MNTTLASLALVAALVACQPQPAHADELPDQLPPDPGRPGWRPPAQRPVPTGRPADPAGVFIPFDDGLAPDPFGTGQGLWGWSPWGENPEEIPLPVVPPLTFCRPLPSAPGPLGVSGAAAAWGWSRRIRNRITTTTQ